jgi:ankyrin repeat protein
MATFDATSQLIDIVEKNLQGRFIITLLGKGADKNKVLENCIWQFLDTNTIITHSKNASLMIHLLLDYGADPNTSCAKGTILMVACHWGDGDLVRRLLDRGARAADDVSYQYSSLLYACAKNMDVEIIKALLAAGADVNQCGLGDVPLTWAVDWGNIAVARVLIEAGADLQLLNHHGETALAHACEYGDTEIVRLLLDAGADVHCRGTAYGRTPLHYAKFEGHKEIVKMLLAKCAVE